MFSNYIFLLMLWCSGALVTLSGCATEYNIATQTEEWIYYDTNKEVSIGKSVARQIEKTYQITTNAVLQERVKRIGERIAAVCDRKEIMYYFNVFCYLIPYVILCVEARFRN